MGKDSKKDRKTKTSAREEKDHRVILKMSSAPDLTEGMHWFQLLPIMAFGAIVIVLMRMVPYERPMQGYFWYSGENDLTDFFSYLKMEAILIIAGLSLLILLYRVFTQTLQIKRTAIYIPMLAYVLMIGISYIFSDNKVVAYLGWNDRFEGTVVLLAYMVMLFYIINTINNEKSVKLVLYAIGGSTFILSLLGISQAVDKDFFRTVIGQKLVTPDVMTQSGQTMWQLIDEMAKVGDTALKFTFINKQIYQTVYNINYVSFYLTLLVPLFGLLFIRSVMKKKDEPLWKKIILGAMFGLLLFNLIGSQSSGGILGIGVAVILAIALVNKKLLTWWKPLVVLLLIAALIGGLTYERWSQEIGGALHGTIGEGAKATIKSSDRSYIDYMITDPDNNTIEVSIEGNSFVMQTYPGDPLALKITDEEGKNIGVKETDVSPVYQFDDERFLMCMIQPYSHEGVNYFVLTIDEKDWAFAVTNDGTYYRNELGKLVSLRKVDASLFKDHLSFGSGRGYIWSRTFPMMKDTALIGYGADTYCIHFPHEDYAGKYNAGWGINTIVDKPHNMYMGMWVGTGGLSVIAFLALLVMYFIHSLKLYFRFKEESWISYAGLGMFLGVFGFAVAGFVDDSTVSVMPLFYTVLGMGIAVNMMIEGKCEDKS
ncbi:MAG: O-antigen ligase family protein [Clostridiales bacterium]|nr:O-antigen ligase family protein [Clostridiales bacterium]